MGWFGGGDKDKKNGQPASNGKLRIATNAPRHWPQVVVDTWVTDQPAINYLSLAAALNDEVESSGGSLAFYQDRLYDDGILAIPLMVTEGEQRTAVFAYPRADTAAASHYSGVRSLLRQREGINAVYYAPEGILPAAPSKVVQGVDTPNFERTEAPRPYAEYALWWPTEADSSFADSAALKHLDRWFEALDGFAIYLFSAFIRDLNIANEPSDSQAQLYRLPEQPLMVAVDAPAGVRAYLQASKAHGLWIAFDVATSTTQRDTLLKLLADFATQIRATAAAKRLPADEQGLVLAWWREARAEMLNREAGGATDLRIGSIADEVTARRLAAGPTTAEERRARTAENPAPGPALVDFAGLLMDRARDMASQAFGSEPEDKVPAPGEPAPPSIPPMLSMRAGSDTWTVFFWYDDTPEASEAARDLIAEHGPADIAAFVCDVMVTIGGIKTDALFLRVQERGYSRSHGFTQRYVPRRRGQSFELTGRWALTGREESIYPSASAPSTNGQIAQPGERAIASAHQAIAEMIEFITMDDPSGARSVEREETRPLLTPRLVLDGGDQPARHVMFALMGAAAGRAAARSATRKEPDARMATFRYDHVRLKNRRFDRELRVVVHERGTPHAFLFAQGYKMPRKETAFETSGEIRLIGPVAPLFAD